MTKEHDHGLVMAAENAAKCVASFDEDMTPESMRNALEQMIDNSDSGKISLLLQAQVLDALFHRLAQKALTAPRWSMGDDKNYVDEKEIALALRTQQLCRATYDSLRRLETKNTNELKDSKNA